MLSIGLGLSQAPQGHAQPAPPNDQFASANTLVGASGNLTWTTVNATKEPGEPNHASNPGGRSVWYRWTPTTAGTVTLNTFGSGFDTLLAVYTGAAVNALAAVTANDDYPGQGTTSSVTFHAEPGVNYAVAIDGFNGASGGFSLRWQYVAAADTILEVLYTNAPVFLIDADADNPNAGYTRDTIPVFARVRTANGSAIDHFNHVVLRYRLLDGGNQAQPIYDVDGQVRADFTLNLPFQFALGANATITNAPVVHLRPASRLSSYTSHRVEMQVVRFGALSGAPALSNPTVFYHFTNRVSGDAAFNALTLALPPAWVRASAAKTVPGRQAFTADVGYFVVRYDHFNNPLASADNIPVRLTYRLLDAASGQAVPLKTSQTNFSVSAFYYEAGSNPVAPHVQQGMRTLAVEPQDSQQLDAVNRLYQLEVTIHHVNQAGQAFTPGNTVLTGARRLLHFNGTLMFGSVPTTFTSLGADPPLISTAPDFVRSTLSVNNGGGYVTAKPTHTYGNGAALSVLLRSNGNAELTSGGVVLDGPAVDLDTAVDVRFVRGPVALGVGGATADLFVFLPAGLGFTDNIDQRYVLGGGSFPGVALAGDLIPASDPVFASPLWMCEESKPVWFEVLSTTWDVDEGRFLMVPSGDARYVRAAELQSLESSPAPVEQRLKRSNDGMYRSVTGAAGVVTGPGGAMVIVARADDYGAAEMTMELAMAGGRVALHMPYGADLLWTGASQVRIEDDAIDPSGSVLSGVQRVRVAHHRDCLLPECGLPKIGPGTNELATGGTLAWTVDGGLAAQGTLDVMSPLQWGYLNDLAPPDFAHETQAFAEAGFLTAGTFWRGGGYGLGMTEPMDGPGALMLSGFSPGDPGAPERPGSAAYEDPAGGGQADYPGLNFRVGEDGALQGESVLGGMHTGQYPLTGRSKYYARWGGVSGIHEAVPGTFPSTASIYDYQIGFDNFGLSFLSSQNEDSTTDGHVYLPLPSDLEQDFEELKFNCLGGLTSAKVPESQAGEYASLNYWQAEIVPQAIQFDRDPDKVCQSGEGWLVLGVKAHATHVEPPLFGMLGFWPNGQILTRQDNKLQHVDSRLELPNAFALRGPGTETYDVVPVADAYFNTQSYYAGGAAPQGFLNIAAAVDVPFFEDLKVHLHTGGKRNGPATESAPLFMMGGWPDFGWVNGQQQHFFSHADFDPDNVGYPAAAAGFPNSVGVASYRDNGLQERYHPRAQRTWLEAIEFDYPLSWKNSLRSFYSFEPIRDFELLVLTTEHQVKHLSADHAELVFGVQYKGLPQFNIANMFFKSTDSVGSAGAFEAADLEAEHGAVMAGLESLDGMLDDDLHGFFKGPFDEILQPAAVALHGSLQSNFDGASKTWTTDPAALVHNAFEGGGGVSLANSVRGRLKDMVGVHTGQKVLKELDEGLQRVDGAIGGIESILAGSGGNRPNAQKLAISLVQEAAVQFLGSFTEGKFQAFLSENAGTLDLLLASFATNNLAVANLRQRLSGTGDWLAELKAHVTDAAITEFLAAAEADVTKLVQGFKPGVDHPFLHYSQAQWTALIRQKIEDRFLGSALAAAFQNSFRQRLYDLDAGMRESLDTSFGVLNRIMRDTINESLASLDNSIAGMLGKLKASAGVGRAGGYAHITGDSLKELRLDARAQFKVPTELGANVYFRFKEYDSEGTAALCDPVAEKWVEVEMAAQDVKIDWIAAGMKASVGTKFTFVNHAVVNLKGKLEMQGDGIAFDPFNLTYMGADFSVGEQENYLSAKVDKLRFRDYEGSGGIFFGRTCSLSPIEFWDPLAAKALGTPPFSGAYVYGEAWIPVSEALLGIPASCMLRISAGMGAGAFFFVEGPTYGGTMLLGVSGEALCIVDVQGKVKLVGVKNPGGLNLQGQGTLRGEIGSCPFCVGFGKTIDMSYLNGEWDVDF